MSRIKPSYLRLFKEGLLNDRANRLMDIVTDCTLCPHRCKIDRRIRKDGKCLSGELPHIASYGPHFGEEPPLVGYNGSGTVFFSNCNMRCIFCQNYNISQSRSGRETDYTDLADIMIELQMKGCHNINFVTPTHMVHAVVRALPYAIEKGLSVPLVYNSGGYDSVQTIHLLDGIFDIYMPDLKYLNNKNAFKLSGVDNYVDEAIPAIRAMHKQVGDLITNDSGIAIKGMIVRHLILPNNQSSTLEIIDFIRDLSPHTYFNLMDQYRPEFLACNETLVNRQISPEEYNEALTYAKQSGLNRLAG